MKFFVVVRYGPSGQPVLFYNTKINKWEKELSKECFYTSEDFADTKAKEDEVDGFVEVYKLEREMKKVYRA